MLSLILTIVGIFALLVGSELWWRRRRPDDEFSRKFIHITVGSLVAFMPFYLAWRYILLLSAAFVVVVVVSKYFHVFQAIHAVERPTWGELFFALAVGLLVVVAREPWIYAAALLHMSLADGLAAIVGVSFGKSNRYHVFGHVKSVAGSVAFLIVSLLILLGYAHFGHPLALGYIVALAIAAMAIENAGVAGLDNLLVPLLVGAVLSKAL